MKKNIKLQFGKYTIAYAVALLLAIPTYGLSLLVLFIYINIVTMNSIYKIKKAIVLTSDSHSSSGTHFDKIHYGEALAYAIEYGRISYRSGNFVKFNIGIDGQQYFVSLQNTPGMNGATLSSVKTDSVFGR